jgi:hypothetical protein
MTDEAKRRFLEVAELEDGMPVSAGGPPFREPPTRVPAGDQVRRFLAAAEQEDGMPVSAGGPPSPTAQSSTG